RLVGARGGGPARRAGRPALEAAVTTADTLQLDEHLDLNAGQIEAALRTLWQEAAERADGTAVARGHVEHLIVYCAEPERIRSAWRSPTACSRNSQSVIHAAPWCWRCCRTGRGR